MTGGRLILLAAAIAVAGVVAARCQAPEKAVALVLASNPAAGVQTDQHFSGCDEARAAGRRNIPSSDPSYRPWMDGDDDGVACEDRRY
jgi:hypothetical protein